MKLRSAVLAVAVALTLLIAILVTQEPLFLPWLIGAVVLCIALGIEREFYGRAQRGGPGAGWIATGERFIDDDSGRPVEVWFNPATGERSYRDAG